MAGLFSVRWLLGEFLLYFIYKLPLILTGKFVGVNYTYVFFLYVFKYSLLICGRMGGYDELAGNPAGLRDPTQVSLGGPTNYVQ